MKSALLRNNRTYGSLRYRVCFSLFPLPTLLQLLTVLSRVGCCLLTLSINKDHSQAQHSTAQHSTYIMSLQDYEEEEEVAILDDCKLTDEQRREVRKQQRALTKDLEGGETLEVETARERNNEIYKNVRYTREAVLDGENLALIANKAAQKVERFIQVRG